MALYLTYSKNTYKPNVFAIEEGNVEVPCHSGNNGCTETNYWGTDELLTFSERTVPNSVLLRGENKQSFSKLATVLVPEVKSKDPKKPFQFKHSAKNKMATSYLPVGASGTGKEYLNI